MNLKQKPSGQKGKKGFVKVQINQKLKLAVPLNLAVQKNTGVQNIYLSQRLMFV
jgi:hypothetical protein